MSQTIGVLKSGQGEKGGTGTKVEPSFKRKMELEL